MTATTQTTAGNAPEPNSADDNQAVATLVARMTAAEIRAWMSENGLTRSRGTRKLESAAQAHEQDPALVEEKAEELRLELPPFKAHCTHCDYEERHETADDAEEAARAHKSENPTHFPRAEDTEGDERLYG